MAFKSLDLIRQDARATLRRFPLAILSSVIGSLAMVVLLNLQHYPKSEYESLWKLAMVSTLGITLFLSLSLFSEVKRHDERKAAGMQACGLALLALYFVSLFKDLKGIDFYTFFLINVDLHLLVAIAPFLFERNLTKAFWQYNKSLFIRIGVSVIYSATIYIGVVIAIVSLDKLFNLNIKGEIYGQIWFIVAGIFNTWFFLGGVPQDIAGLETREDYPKGLRIFTQFILIPLVILYYSILYLYMAKIIVTWTLPVGWLSSLIIGASLLGILTLLLVYPLRDRSEFGWIKSYAKNFYIALFPLVILMGVAIFRRIFDYGITVERYFVLLFTIWLLYISVKFTFRPNTDIRLIPTSMCLLIVMATFGPLSAVQVSSKSQMVRLEGYLARNGYFSEGKLQKVKRKVPFKDNAEISSIVGYLYRTHGLQILNRWAPAGTDFKNMDQYAFCQTYLGIEVVYDYRNRWDNGNGPQYYFSYGIKLESLRVVKGFDYMYEINGYYRVQNQEPWKRTIETPDGNLDVVFGPNENGIQFQSAGGAVTFDVARMVNALREAKGINGYNIEPSLMTVESENEHLKMKCVFSSIGGNFVDDLPKVENFNAQIYLKFKGKE